MTHEPGNAECVKGAWTRRRLLVCVVLLGVLAGCRHDMYNQPRYKPLAGSAFFADDRSARTPPEGTVARGHLDADPAFYEGQVNGKLVNVVRVPAGSANDVVQAAALADEKVQSRIAGKNVFKIIVVPGKTVNLVVK